MFEIKKRPGIHLQFGDRITGENRIEAQITTRDFDGEVDQVQEGTLPVRFYHLTNTKTQAQRDDILRKFEHRDWEITNWMLKQLHPITISDYLYVTETPRPVKQAVMDQFETDQLQANP